SPPLLLSSPLPPPPRSTLFPYTTLFRSNPIGLDRNQLGDTRIVRFDRVGPKVLLVQSNPHFRAIDGSAAEQKAVAESFASSVLRSEEHTSELQSRGHLVCRLLLEKKKIF